MVVFWDLTSGEAHSKSVGNLKFLAANGDVCAVVILEKGDPRPTKKTVRAHRVHTLYFVSQIIEVILHVVGASFYLISSYSNVILSYFDIILSYFNTILS
jgi:hypothetical protein